MRKRPKREIVSLALSKLLVSKNNEVSFLSLNSHQANAIYGDRKLMIFFESKMWISMSKNDDPIKLEELPISLQKTLVGKRFLIVLEGVWNHKKEMDILFKILSSIKCKQGSKVISIIHTTEISDLDDSILMKILSILPIRTIFVSKCVNKDWCKLIEDPFFSKLHLAQATTCPIFRTIEPKIWPSCLHMIEVKNTNDLNKPLKFHSKLLPPTLPFLNSTTALEIPPKFGIVNSCNGLLCVCTCPFNNPIYIWNPITGEYILIPKPERNPNTNNYNMDKEIIGESYYTDFVVSGFGFSSNANQYKVMRAFGLVQEDDIYIIVFQVWILGSKTWKTLGSLLQWTDIGLKVTRRQTLLPKEASYRQSFCVYLNSSVHWLAICNSDTLCICSFNFDQENIIRFSLPESFYESEEEDYAIGNMRLGVLGDCLYVSDLRCYDQFELWVLKEYTYENPLWTKAVVINNFTLNIWPRGLYRPIKYLENGDLLMFHPSNALVCYNLEEKSFRYFKICEVDSEFEMIPHIPNLIPMKDIVNMEEGSQVEILNARDDVEWLPQNWKEYSKFALKEENEDAISAAFSKIL